MSVVPHPAVRDGTTETVTSTAKLLGSVPGPHCPKVTERWFCQTAFRKIRKVVRKREQSLFRQSFLAAGAEERLFGQLLDKAETSFTFKNQQIGFL